MRPANIRMIMINFPQPLKVAVIPVLRPTVAKALTASNAKSKIGAVSVKLNKYMLILKKTTLIPPTAKLL